MDTTTIQNDRNVDELAQRLFGERAPELRERLLELNPHLRGLETLPPGTPVLIPRDPVIDREDPNVPVEDPAAQAVAQLTEMLDGLEKAELARFARRREAFDNTIRLASEERIRIAAGPERAQLLADAVTAANREIAANDRARDTFLEQLRVARAAVRPRRRRAVRS